MTILEATVEVVKAAVSPGDNSSTRLLVNQDYRKEFLLSIEMIYKKFQDLENGKLP